MTSKSINWIVKFYLITGTHTKQTGLPTYWKKPAEMTNTKQDEIKMNLILAADKNMGIGKNNVLPWHLPSEFNYFLNMTSKPRPDKDGNKRKNIIIIGRKTWQTMDQLTSKPFPNSINIVLSRNKHLQNEISRYKNTVLCTTLEDAIGVIKDNIRQIDQVWILGGAQVYKATSESQHFYRLYLTIIHKSYECDSYFPKDIDLQDVRKFKLLNYEEINDERVPNGIKIDKESNVKFEVRVYQKA